MDVSVLSVNKKTLLLDQNHNWHYYWWAKYFLLQTGDKLKEKPEHISVEQNLNLVQHVRDFGPMY